jgi:hypothetical protein
MQSEGATLQNSTKHAQWRSCCADRFSCEVVALKQTPQLLRRCESQQCKHASSGSRGASCHKHLNP